MSAVIEQLIGETDDIPKELKGKIPEGFALVNVDEAYARINDKIDAVTERSLRHLSQTATKFGFGGLIVGAGLGALGGYFYCQRRLDKKYDQIAEAEIAEMRQYYNEKVVAAESAATKPQLEALVREKGYSAEPPMAVTPPAAIVDAAETLRDESLEEHKKRLNLRQDANQEVEPEETQNVFDKAEPQAVDGWDYYVEKSRRSPLRPYVIHVDEKDDTEEVYSYSVFTYYEEDDVVCNEEDEVIGEPERDNDVGEANLQRFGHGSGDPNVVYIRNDRKEMVIELNRSPNSYAEEVHGFEHSDTTYPRQRRKMRFDDDE